MAREIETQSHVGSDDEVEQVHDDESSNASESSEEELEDSTLEDSEAEDTESDWGDENHLTLRAKWCLDKAQTLDECIEHLHAFIGYIEELKKDGWYLTTPVDDDYGFLKRNPITAVTNNSNSSAN